MKFLLQSIYNKASTLFVLTVFCLVVSSCSESDNKDDSEKTTGKKKSKHHTLKTDDVPSVSAQQAVTYKGRCISISLCGVDSRLNENVQHADANHVLRFWIDEGALEVIDIPRDTRSSGAGLDSSLNNLANFRANRGREAYLKRVAEICKIPKIDYYVELGFSQAMGLLELIGHKNEADKTLRVLRTRQAFDAGDYQRCFNQGNFIKQMAIKHFSKTTSWFRDPLLRSGLFIVETNIPTDTAKFIIDKLEENGFPDNNKCMVHIMPAVGYKLALYDLSDQSVVHSLNTRIDECLNTKSSSSSSQEDYCISLKKLITEAVSDTAKYPKESIRILSRPYTQRAWMQVKDKSKRSEYAQRICTILIASHTKVKHSKEALQVLSFYEEHKELLEDL